MSWHKENSALLDLFCMQASICCAQPLANRFSLLPSFLFISYRLISLVSTLRVTPWHRNISSNLSKSNYKKDLAWSLALFIQSIYTYATMPGSACYLVSGSSVNTVCLHSYDKSMIRSITLDANLKIKFKRAEGKRNKLLPFYLAFPDSPDPWSLFIRLLWAPPLSSTSSLLGLL